MAADLSMSSGIDFRIDKREVEQQHSGGLCYWSPNGDFIVAVKGNAVRVLALDGAAAAGAGDDIDTGALTVHKMFSCKDAVDSVQWSPDSQFVLCAMYKRQEVQVWAVDPDSTWNCRISEGVVAGMVYATWSPDSRHIVTVADFQLHISIWSLTSKSVYYVKNPKFGANGLAFSNDGRYMAVAQREKTKDHIGVYSCDTWGLVSKFSVDMDDVESLAWSPDDSVIVVTNGALKYMLQVYSPDGYKQQEYSAYSDALGIKTLSWAPSGHFLAVGSYDQKARVMNHLTWRAVAEYSAASPVDGTATNVFREVLDAEEDMSVFAKEAKARSAAAEHGAASDSGAGAARKPRAGAKVSAMGARGRRGSSGPDHTIDAPSHFIIDESGVDVPSDMPKPGVGPTPPRIGVGIIDWSADSRYLAMRNDNMPTAVWIFSAIDMELTAMLLMLSPVRSFKWGPVGCRLAVVTGNSKIFFWEPAGATCLMIKEGFSGVGLRWSPDGSKLMVLSRSSWTVGHLTHLEAEA